MGDQVVVNPAAVQRIDLSVGGAPVVNFSLPPAIKVIIGETATTVSVGLVPPGGEAGQVLTKTTGADYAIAWQPGGVGTGGTSLLYGIAFPADPEDGTWFVFSDDVANGLTWKDTDGSTDITAAGAGDAARYNGTDWVKIGSFADQTIPDAYTLPTATESVRGGVKGATSAQAGAASGTTILGWTQNRIRQVIAAALPSGSSSEAQGTTAVRRIWTPAKLREAVNAAVPFLVPAVFRTGNAAIIPVEKLGSGVRSGSTYLKGDGTFGEGPTPAAGGPLDSISSVKVGNTVSISGSSTTGPAFSDLSDFFWLSFSYTRTNPGIRFNTLVRKAEIEGRAVGNPYPLQLQGGGGAYGNLYGDGGNLIFGVFDAGYSAITCNIYKVTGAAGDAVSYDDTALQSDISAIEQNLDARDAPIKLGAYVDADASDLAAGYGCYLSDDGTYQDSDFVVAGSTSTVTARFYIRVPKHKSRYGVRVHAGGEYLPRTDPASFEHLAPVSADTVGLAQNPPLFSGVASDISDYFYVAFVHGDGAVEGNLTGGYKLQIAPVIYPEYVSIYYWQDGTNAPRTAAGHAVAATGRTGELIPLIFPAANRPRNLHFLIPDEWAITDILIGGLSSFDDFTTRAFNTISTIYDSPRIKDTGEITCLIRLKES